MSEKVRISYQEELERLESQTLGGFDLISKSLDRTIEAVENQDVDLAEFVIADDDQVDGRYLEVHQGLI